VTDRYPSIKLTMTDAQAAELEHEIAVVLWQRGRDPASRPDEDVVDVALARASGYVGRLRHA